MLGELRLVASPVPCLLRCDWLCDELEDEIQEGGSGGSGDVYT